MYTEIVSDIQNNFCTQHVIPMVCKKKELLTKIYLYHAFDHTGLEGHKLRKNKCLLGHIGKLEDLGHQLLFQVFHDHTTMILF